MTATRALLSEVEALAEGLGGYSERLKELLRRELLSAECTLTQARTLATLRSEGPLRLTDLAQLQQVTQPSMSILVARMAAHGLVAKRPDPSSPRATRISITMTGHALLDELLARRTDVLRDRLEALTEEERERLSAALPALDKLCR